MDHFLKAHLLQETGLIIEANWQNINAGKVSHQETQALKYIDHYPSYAPEKDMSNMKKNCCLETSWLAYAGCIDRVKTGVPRGRA